MRVRITALAGTAVAIAFAGLALLSGLDRAAAGTPMLTGASAAPYALNAPFNAALAAATAHHWPQAETSLAHALIAAPVDEHLIGTLGQVRLAAGDPGGARAAFSVSALRGWRDPATHAYWMTQSIAAGDFTSAAIHADALLRMQVSDDARDQILDSLLEYDDGRTALAQRLRTRPPWSDDFVVKLRDLTSDELLAHADVAHRAGPNAFTCAGTAGMINLLIGINAAQQAQDLYRNSCHATPGLVQDVHFQSYFKAQPFSHLGWFLPDGSQIAPAQNDPAGISFSSNSDVTQPILAQRIVMGPGTYRLTWNMLDTPADLTGKLLVDLTCKLDINSARPGEPVAGKPGLRSVQVRVDDSCPIKQLNFWLSTMDGTIKIDNVSLQKVTDQ